MHFPIDIKHLGVGEKPHVIEVGILTKIKGVSGEIIPFINIDSVLIIGNNLERNNSINKRIVKTKRKLSK